MTEALGIGAATEARTASPDWVRTYPHDQASLRVACLRCVLSETVQVVGQRVGWVTAQLAFFERQHSRCELGRRR